jgi:hypothetical protein
MDPWSIAAIVGLAFAGQKLSKEQKEEQEPSILLSNKPMLDEDRCPDKSTNQFYSFHSLDQRNMTPDIGRAIDSNLQLKPKCEISSLQDRKPQLVHGQPVYNLYDRQGVSNKMNNLQPIERKNIGPGLGVESSVPATGGFQQFFRVLPNNPNDERLIQLAGNMGGPVDAVVKGAPATAGKLTQFPDKTYTYEPSQNSGQGQGGALRGAEDRPEWIKMNRPTIRDQTGYRGKDDIQYGTSQYNVYQGYADLSNDISLSKEGSLSTWKKLPHITDNRSKEDRSGNEQRMNVRADPLDAGGLVSNLRREYRTDEPGPVNGTRFQQYKDAEFYKLNDFKSTPNPLVNNLSIAQEILKNNPIAIAPLSG